MVKFSQKTIEELKYYVYVLVDPSDGKVFYVGKGTRNRVFNHLTGSIKNPLPTDKILTIKKIIEKGKKVKHFIIRHGLEESSAFEIESTLIDLLTFNDFRHISKISNLVSGHNAWDKGIKTVNDIEALYAARPLKKTDIQHNVLLININKTYRPGISPYEATRKSWVLGERSLKTVEYVLSEYRGIVRAIYKPDKWFKTKDGKRKYFVGTEVTDLKVTSLYLNKRYPDKKQGQANPIKYLRKKASRQQSA